MKILIDTNIFIPLEPTLLADREEASPLAAHFSRISNENGHQLYVHPLQRLDIDNDKDSNRKALRKQLFLKYPQLQSPPERTQALIAVVGLSDRHSHDFVDDMLLAALAGHAVNFLVTEDGKLHGKARRLGISNQVVRLSDAVAMLETLAGRSILPPPAVESVVAYNLRSQDPIFDSIRADYPGFDKWLVKCMKEHRQSWTIMDVKSNTYAAIAIVNEEGQRIAGLDGKVLKICTFKVQSEGLLYGELLLKTIYDYASVKSFDWLFVEVLEKQERLVDLLTDNGFIELPERTARGELRLAKPRQVSIVDSENLPPLEFDRRYAPFHLATTNVQRIIIPIQPQFHRILFPDAENQVALFGGVHAYGNSIKKAYLCNAAIRDLKPGDLLFFYRSVDLQAVTVVAYLEDFRVSSNADEIVEFVGKRTVYSSDDICMLCERPVVAILFRQVKILKNAVSLGELLTTGVLKAAPQSITRFDNQDEWIDKLLRA